MLGFEGAAALFEATERLRQSSQYHVFAVSSALPWPVLLSGTSDLGPIMTHGIPYQTRLTTRDSPNDVMLRMGNLGGSTLV